MAFGVVLFTLLVQSTTMKPLLRRLGISARDPIQIEYETRHARMMAFRAAALHLDQMQRDGFLSQHAWETLQPQTPGANRADGPGRTRAATDPPRAGRRRTGQCSSRASLAQRSTLRSLQRDGVISEEVFEKLVAEIDAGLMGEDRVAEGMTGGRTKT